MDTRSYLATLTLGLFLVPAVLLVYAAWFDGDIENSIYLAVQSVRGEGGTMFDAQLVGAGRFLVQWWWFISIASIGASTLVATFLAASDPGSSAAGKSLWVASFFLTSVSIPVYCLLQVGRRPGDLSRPTARRDAA